MVNIPHASFGTNATIPNDDCSFFQNLGCQNGSDTRYPDDWADRAFQTWLPGSEKHQDGFEGLGRVMCYNNITYASDRQSAEVEAVCRQHSSVQKLEYNWAGQGFTSESKFSADSSLNDALSLVVKATDSDGAEFTITMESLNFIWQAPTVGQGSEYNGGQKGAIVEMFGWPHADVK